MNKESNVYATLDEIFVQRKSFSITRGIYFLFSGEEIVYVGQGQVVEERIYDHRKNKEFDSYYIIEIKEGDLNDIEAYFIIKYQPKYNNSVPGNSRFLMMQKLKERYNSNAHVIKKAIKKHCINQEFLGYYDVVKVDVAMRNN